MPSVCTVREYYERKLPGKGVCPSGILRPAMGFLSPPSPRGGGVLRHAGFWKKIPRTINILCFQGGCDPSSWRRGGEVSPSPSPPPGGGGAGDPGPPPELKSFPAQGSDEGRRFSTGVDPSGWAAWMRAMIWGMTTSQVSMLTRLGTGRALRAICEPPAKYKAPQKYKAHINAPPPSILGKIEFEVKQERFVSSINEKNLQKRNINQKKTNV